MGIGGFRLSNKTSTQTDNATGGLAKGGKGKWGQTEVLGNTEGPHKTRDFEKIATMLKRYLFLKPLKKCVAKPNFYHCTVFDENLVAVHMKKTELVFNKPVYLGMRILDLSKILMYEFHYNYVKKKFGSKANVLFIDTDTLCYEIETEDFFKDISADLLEKFDMSNFSLNQPSGIPTSINKKVPGMFKDEAGGKSSKSLLACERSSTKSRNLMVKKKKSVRVSREMS